MLKRHTTIQTLITLTTLTLIGTAGCGESTLKTTAGGGGVDGATPVGQIAPEDVETMVSSGALSIDVETPAPGEIFTSAGIVRVTGTATGLDVVVIDGQRVDVIDGAFTADVNPPEGEEVVTIAGEGLTPILIPVIIDREGPTLEVSSPERGTFLVKGQQDQILVKGVASNPGAGIAEVLVNGEVVTVGPTGEFETTLTPEPGLTTVKVEAIDPTQRKADTIRGVLYGEFSPFGEPVPDAISGRITANTFDVLEQAIEAQLMGGMVNDLLSSNIGGGNPEVRGISFSRVEVDLVPVDGALRANIKIFDLDVDVRYDTGLFGLKISGDVKSNPAELTADVMVNAAPNGQIGVSLGSSNVNLHGFRIDIDGVFNGIDRILSGLVDGIAEDALMDVLNDVVIAELFDPELLNQSVDFMGRTINLGLKVSTLSIDPGGATLGASVGVDLLPSAEVPEAPGVYTTKGAAPMDSDAPRMVRLSMADDLINNILSSFWRGGVLNLNVAEVAAATGSDISGTLNVGVLGLIVPGLGDAFGNETPINLVMRPLLPPIASVDPQSGNLMIKAYDLLLDLYVEPVGGEPVKAATIALMLDLEVGFEVMDGELTIVPKIAGQADLVASALPIDASLIENGLGLIFANPALLGLNDLNQMFNFSELDLFGIKLANVGVRADGQAGDFLTFDTDLTP